MMLKIRRPRRLLICLTTVTLGIVSCGPAITPSPMILPTTTLTEVAVPKSTPIPEPSKTPVYFSPPAISEPGLLWVNPIDGSDLVGVPAGEFSMGMTRGIVMSSPYTSSIWMVFILADLK